MFSALKRSFKLTQYKTEEISNCGEDAHSLAQANNHLALNLYHLLVEEKGNVFFSPFSVSTIMAMLLCASDSETESEMMAALGYDKVNINKEDIADIFDQQLSVFLENKHSYKLSWVNSMLSQKSLEVKDKYKQVVVESFKASLLDIDFENDCEKALKQINKWVKKKTNNLIPDLLQIVNPGNVVFFLNAVYFKGTWLEKFNRRETAPRNFYNKGLEDNVTQVNMMHMKESFPDYMIEFFPYYEDQSLQALVLPYVGEEVSILILLPRAKDGLESVEKSLTPLTFKDLKTKLQMKKVEVFLPSFRLEYAKSLIPYLRDLGIGRVFSHRAELSVASNSPNFAVSEIFHKAVLEVNEEGIERENATVEDIHLARDTDPVFITDHPFAFVIYNTMSDLILFMGRVEEL